MLDVTIPVSAADDLARMPCFTLATALILLGHECPGGCPRIVTERRAAVWAVHPSGSAWVHTLVEVAFADVPIGRGQDLTNAINECVRPDHLQVRVRAGRPLAARSAGVRPRSG